MKSVGKFLRQHRLRTAAWLLLDLFNQMYSEKMKHKVEFKVMKERALRAEKSCD